MERQLINFRGKQENFDYIQETCKSLQENYLRKFYNNGGEFDQLDAPIGDWLCQIRALILCLLRQNNALIDRDDQSATSVIQRVQENEDRMLLIEKIQNQIEKEFQHALPYLVIFGKSSKVFPLGSSQYPPQIPYQLDQNIFKQALEASLGLKATKNTVLNISKHFRQVINDFFNSAFKKVLECICDLKGDSLLSLYSETFLERFANQPIKKLCKLKLLSIFETTLILMCLAKHFNFDLIILLEQFKQGDNLIQSNGRAILTYKYDNTSGYYKYQNFSSLQERTSPVICAYAYSMLNDMKNKSYTFHQRSNFEEFLSQFIKEVNIEDILLADAAIHEQFQDQIPYTLEENDPFAQPYAKYLEFAKLSNIGGKSQTTDDGKAIEIEVKTVHIVHWFYSDFQTENQKFMGLQAQ